MVLPNMHVKLATVYFPDFGIPILLYPFPITTVTLVLIFGLSAFSLDWKLHVCFIHRCMLVPNKVTATLSGHSE